MIGDIGDLVGMQARVDHMGDRADAGDGVIQLEMPIGVPGQRRHPVTGFDAHGDQGIGQLANTRGRLAIGIAVDRPLNRAAGDRRVRTDPLSVFNNAADQQRHGHHLPHQGRCRACAHGAFLGYSCYISFI